MKWSELEYQNYLKNKKQSSEPKPAKYRNVPTIIDGIRFDSRAEANFYQVLLHEVASTRVQYFLRQVPIHLLGGVIMRVDFMVVYANGSIRYLDVKGAPPTQDWLNKRKTAEALYPFKIETVDGKGHSVY